MKCINLKPLAILIFNLLVFQTGFTQKDRWIDKNESEDYVSRHECSFVQAGDAFIMFGGREQAQQLDVYDFKKNSWSQGGFAPKQFNHFQATFYEGFVWVIGSFQTNTFPKEIPADYIWLYQPASKKWIKGPKIPNDRRRGGAGLVVYRDKFYLVGGNTIGHNGGFTNWFDMYDPVNNNWERLQNAPNARDHFSAVVANDKLYALGGRHSGGKGGVFAPLIADVDVFDFKTNIWSILNEPLPTPRAAAGVALFKNQIYVIGGEGKKPGPAYRTVEAYSLMDTTWVKKANMHHPRHGTQAIVSGEGIYIAAGSPKRGGGRQHNMEVYNEDKPEGKRLVASKLEVPKKVTLTPNSVATIVIKNQKGNTGSFIKSIKISGKGKKKYQLNSNFNLCLLKEDGTFELEIQGIENKISDTAKVTIIYNKNKKSVINLITKS